MYRNFRSCNTNSCPICNDKKPILEDICDDVLTLSNYENDDCSCGFDEDTGPFPQNPVLGESYVPNQMLKTTFMPNVGLKLGTIFPELVRPYMPGQSMEVIDYLRKNNAIKEGCNRV